MDFRDWMDKQPTWKVEKPKKDRRKFMSKVLDANDDELDDLADEMKKHKRKKKKKKKDDIHSWLLERQERMALCMKLLFEAKLNNLKQPKKWKNGDKI